MLNKGFSGDNLIYVTVWFLFLSLFQYIFLFHAFCNSNLDALINCGNEYHCASPSFEPY